MKFLDEYRDDEVAKKYLYAIDVYPDGGSFDL